MNQEIIRNIIDSFFKGIDYFDEPEIGHVWIAKHGKLRVGRNYPRLMREKFEREGITMIPPDIVNIDENYPNYGFMSAFGTLIIEPKEGGQYEVAVRIWSENEWRGYKINDFDSRHYLVGINTRGH